MFNLWKINQLTRLIDFNLKSFINKYHLNRRYFYILFFCFYWIGTFLFAKNYHEPWRDELHTFLIVRSAKSITDLWYLTRYEGHPMLWYILLYSIKNFPNQIQIAQCINAFFIAGTVTLVFSMLKKNLSRIDLFLLLFSYYFVYEYAVIFRNYSCGLFFFFGGIFFFNRQSYITSIFFLCLAVNSNIFSFFLAVSFFLFYFLDFNFFKIPKQLFIVSILLFSLFSLFSLLTIMPSRDSSFSSMQVRSFIHFLISIANFYRGFIPIPLLSVPIWGSNIAGAFQDGISIIILQSILGLVLLIIFGFVVFEKRDKPTFFFSLAILLMIVFAILKFEGYQRHHGHFFIALIATFVLNSYTNESAEWFLNWRRKLLFRTLFIIHFFVGIFFLWKDFSTQFSASNEAASIIKSRYDKYNIIGQEDLCVEPLEYYLNKRLFYPNLIKRDFNFLVWNANRLPSLSDKNLIKKFNEIKKKQNSILVTSYPILGMEKSLLFCTGTSMAAGEQYYIYN